MSELETVNKEIADNDSSKKNGDVSPNKYLENRTALSEKRKEIMANCGYELNIIKSDFFDFVDEWNHIKGSAITDDSMLVKNDVGITDNQLRELFEKYRYNPTMMQLLLKYGKEHNMFTDHAITADDYKEEFQRLCYLIKNGINGKEESYNRTLIKNEHFKRYISSFKEFCDLSEMDKYIKM